ncbi:MAG: hypothetical protein LBC84_10015 [Prevotellaceae bacterium]|jgi:hypothetical protein|nr:hypothetical protein [Prevotellaceae bacterium]
MYRFFLLLFVSFLLTFPPLDAQSISKESLRFVPLSQEVEVTRERIFEGAGLFGFMNGGAELFLEYHFQQMLEQRIIYQGVPFVIEYYLMDNPKNTYGIYSIHTYKCQRIDQQFQYECLTSGLLQFCHHCLYVTIKCVDKNADSLDLLDSLAIMIKDNNPIKQGDEVLDLSAFPPPHSGFLYYVCGDLGLSAAYIGWARHFAPFSNYTIWMQIDPITGGVSAQITFDSKEDMESFCRANNNHFTYTVIPPSTLKVCPLM